MRTTTEKLVVASLLAALIFIATVFFKIPSPIRGYINLGDCVILLAGWILPSRYSFLAAGVGSALADILSGFVIYAPATFLIKGLMAVIAGQGYILLKKKFNNETVAQIISGIAAELEMILGYFIFEAILYGTVAAVANLAINGVQATAGLLLGVVLIKVLAMQRIIKLQ